MYPRIRVARVFSRLNIGGPSIHVILVTARLDPSRYESRLLVGREGPHEGNMAGLASELGFAPQVIPALGREISPLNDLAATLALWRVFRQWRPHIVHTHTSKAGFAGRVAARLAAVPVVVHTFHGHVFEGYFGPFRSGLFLRLERVLAALTDAVVAISSCLRDDLIARDVASGDKIQVIPLGLDLEPYLAIEGRRGRFRRELRLGDGDLLAGIVGRLVPVKDHDVFLQAAARVCAADRRVHFAVIGDGERRQELEAEAAALGLTGRVHFAGWRRDLCDIYADLDLVVLSSRNEGTPVSILEGAAAGRPSVATRVGGVPDIVRDGVEGLLVPAMDGEALADAIRLLLGDAPRRLAMGNRARERVREGYSVDRLVEDLDNLYTDLLRRKGIELQASCGVADPNYCGP